MPSIPKSAVLYSRPIMRHVPKNKKLIDLWSLTHILWGAFLTWLLGPWIALLIMVLWEPFEVKLLGPFLMKHCGVVFGNEGWQNSASDIVMDIIGILFSIYWVIPLLGPGILG